MEFCPRRGAYWMFLLGLVAVPQYGQAPPDQEQPLVGSIITVMKGEIRPAHTAVISGKQIAMPDGCAFRYRLPPDKNALHWHQLGKAKIDIENNSCEAAFEIGAPSRLTEAWN
jgi:hypothetical protein